MNGRRGRSSFFTLYIYRAVRFSVQHSRGFGLASRLPWNENEVAMRKILTALTAVMLAAATPLVMSDTANAQWGYHHGWGHGGWGWGHGGWRWGAVGAGAAVGVTPAAVGATAATVTLATVATATADTAMAVAAVAAAVAVAARRSLLSPSFPSSSLPHITVAGASQRSLRDARLALVPNS